MRTALSWAVGVLRALTGVVLLAAPDEAAERWVGGSGTREQYLVRGIGGRDLAIGAGLLHALTTDRDPSPWLTASVLGDVVDAVSALALDEPHARKTLAIAGGFGVLGVVARATLPD